MTNKKQALNVPIKAHKSNPRFSLKVLDEFSELKDWIKQISRYCKVEDFIYISDYKKGKIRIKIFTKDHQYGISAHLARTNQDDSYLGCIANTRKSRAGEDWSRGNDLADGSYSAKTWQEIKDDILAYELVKVVNNSPDKQPEGKVIEAVVEKDSELMELIKGNLRSLKQNDELGFMWNKNHFVIRKGEFSN